MAYLDLRLTLDGQQAASQAFKDLGDPRLQQVASERAAGIMLRGVQMAFRKQAGPDSGPWPPSLRATMQGGRTLVDTGLMLASIMKESSAARSTVFTNKKQAPILNEGGTIVPKTKQWLAIPFPGTFSAGELRRGVRPADFLGSFRKQVFTTWGRSDSAGRPAPIMFLREPTRKGSKSTKITPLFILRKSVTIPRRQFMALWPEDWPSIEQAFIDAKTKGAKA